MYFQVPWLEHLAPFRKSYKHHETGEDNGDSHLEALLIYHEVIVPITAGKLDLGTWQRTIYAEFDWERQASDRESDGGIRQWPVIRGKFRLTILARNSTFNEKLNADT